MDKKGRKTYSKNPQRSQHPSILRVRHFIVGGAKDVLGLRLAWAAAGALQLLVLGWHLD